jgi:predicted RNA-binding Zn ribbon-like protein
MIAMEPVKMRSYITEPLELIGGALAVDFVNTVTWRGDSFDNGERLTSYEQFAYWAAGAGAMDQQQRSAVLELSAQRPVDSAKALSDAIALRESIARLFAGGKKRANASDLATINRILRETTAPEQIFPPEGGGGYRRSLAVDDAADLLRLPLYRIACSAVDIATSDTLDQLSSCANERCGWMFIDKSRSRRRRWCNMKTCGNRNKVKKFYSRTSQSGSCESAG